MSNCEEYLLSAALIFTSQYLRAVMKIKIVFPPTRVIEHVPRARWNEIFMLIKKKKKKKKKQKKNSYGQIKIQFLGQR